MTLHPTSTTLSLGGSSAGAWPTLLNFASRNALPLGGTIAVLLVAATLVAWRLGKIRRALVYASFAMSLGINAEGMWVIATHRLHLPPVFAVGVFAVAEMFMVTEMSLAREQYQRTTGRDGDGRIVRAGHPGKHGRAVFGFAFVFGLIVAFNSASVVEVLLRLALPMAVAVLWWNDLTAEGTGRPKSRLAWTPTRLAERLGMLVPDVDDDLAAMARDRRVKAMIRAARRVGTTGRRYGRYQRRLSRLASTADEDMVAAVLAQVRRGLAVNGQVIAVHREVLAGPDRAADTAPPGAVDSEPDSEPDTTHPNRPDNQPVIEAPIRVATVRPNVTSRKIAALRRKWPAKTQAEIAEKAGVSEKTAQRYWAITAPASAAEQDKANGHEVPALLPTGGQP